MGVTYRITAKVAKKVKEPLNPKPSISSGFLGDWYINLLYVERKQVLLAVSEKTLLPQLIPAKDLQSFPERFRASLNQTLIGLGIPSHMIENELEQMSGYSFAKTASRQVLGSMNDFASVLACFVGYNESLAQLALRLARMPCRPIGMENPIERTCKLFGVDNPYPLTLDEVAIPKLVETKDFEFQK